VKGLYLFEDFGEGCLIDFDKLLKLVEIAIEQSETFIQSHI